MSPQPVPLAPFFMLMLVLGAIVVAMIAIAESAAPQMTLSNENPVKQGDVLRFETDENAASIKAELLDEESETVTLLKLRKVDSTGDMAYRTVLPEDIAPGDYRLEAIARGNDGDEVLFEESFDVTVE